MPLFILNRHFWAFRTVRKLQNSSILTTQICDNIIMLLAILCPYIIIELDFEFFMKVTSLDARFLFSLVLPQIKLQNFIYDQNITHK